MWQRRDEHESTPVQKKAGDEIDVDRGTPITVARQCANSKVGAVLGESTAEPGPSEPETRTEA